MVPSLSKNEISKEEPRIFFRQMLEASGLFPIEINVPDTISSMMDGMSYLYGMVTSTFSSGSGSETETQEQDSNTQQINRRKKLKNLKQESEAADEDDVMDFFMFNMLVFLMY